MFISTDSNLANISPVWIVTKYLNGDSVKTKIWHWLVPHSSQISDMALSQWKRCWNHNLVDHTRVWLKTFCITVLYHFGSFSMSKNLTNAFNCISLLNSNIFIIRLNIRWVSSALFLGPMAVSCLPTQLPPATLFSSPVRINIVYGCPVRAHLIYVMLNQSWASAHWSWFRTGSNVQFWWEV